MSTTLIAIVWPQPRPSSSSLDSDGELLALASRWTGILASLQLGHRVVVSVRWQWRVSLPPVVNNAEYMDSGRVWATCTCLYWQQWEWRTDLGGGVWVGLAGEQ